MQGSQSAARTLALLEAVTLDGGRTPAAELILRAGLAPATGRRLLALLVERELLMRVARGRYAGGDRLRQLAARVSPHARLIEIARPILRRLAQAERATAYLGVFEGEMVTYLVKEGAQTGFTREQMQLEAYCTGIGKTLLAQLVDERLTAYLAAPLVPITDRTITEPAILRAELAATRVRGYAIDDREMADDIGCIAVPLQQLRGSDYAISLSGSPARFHPGRAPDIAARLQRTAEEISRRLGH
jgi:DNA-binding IclR family transcriptional regulator